MPTSDRHKEHKRSQCAHTADTQRSSGSISRLKRDLQKERVEEKEMDK